MLCTTRFFFSYKGVLVLLCAFFLWRFYICETERNFYTDKFKNAPRSDPSMVALIVRQANTTRDVVDRMSSAWLKRVDLYQFFSVINDGNGTVRIPGGRFAMNHEAQYRWLSHWIVSIARADDFDFYIFTFDTTYLIINNIRRDLKGINPDEPKYAIIGDCEHWASPAVVLTRAAVLLLQEGVLTIQNTIHTTKCYNNEKQRHNLCGCLEMYGLSPINLATDDEGRSKYLVVQRHFSRQEMKMTMREHGYYWDGKEIFESLSTDMVAFLNVVSLEQTVLDTLLYRLNRQEV
uniref:Core-2/I-Branching enzyme n=1 Tax=Panagrellus redivivus TaxID=6233 RepID=A0A7E4VNU8_PANRE